MTVNLINISGFYWIRLRVFFDVVEELTLSPYPGSSLRGALGHNLRAICCHVQDQRCPECLISSQCAYRAIFEPTPSGDFLSSFSAVPPPYVVEPSLKERVTYSVDDTLSFSLVLIGTAYRHIPHIIVALERFQRSGLGVGRSQVRLREVHARVPGGDRVLYDDHSKNVDLQGARVTGEDLMATLTPFQSSDTDMSVNFRIMTRLKSEGQLVREPRFEVLARSLMRRASMLGRLYCELDVDWPFNELTQLAGGVEILQDNTDWFDWARRSSRQRRMMKFGGIYGSVTYRQVPTCYLPLLALGHHLHVGKNTTFGLGAIDVDIT